LALEGHAPRTPAVGIGSVEEDRGTCQLSAAGSATDSWLHWRPFGWLLAAGPLGVLLGDQPLDSLGQHTGQRSVKQEKQKTTVLAMSVLRCQQAAAAFAEVGQEASGSQNVPLFA
jgi:hypothetical protein